MRRSVRLRACLLIAGIYLLVGGISYALSNVPGCPHTVWPAAGVALGLLLTRQSGRVEGLALGAFLLWLLIQLSQGGSLPSSLVAATGLSLGSTVQAMVGAQLVRHRLGLRPGLERGRPILEFLILAGPLACGIGATVATVVLGGPEQLDAKQLGSLWLCWWVGDGIGVMVFAPLTLMALPSQQDLWGGRRALVAIPSLLVLALCLLGFSHLEKLEAKEWQTRLQQRGELAQATFERTIAAHQEALYGVKSLIDTSGVPSPERFRRYTAGHLQRLSGLQAISWNPAVSERDVAAFEAEQRQLDGRSGFRILQRSRGGALIPARGRSTLVPVTLIEPLARNQSALGFDISSEPIRAEALRRARLTNLPSATAPIRLVQATGTQTGVLLILPVSEPKGFVVGVYQLDKLLQNCFPDQGWASFQIRLLEKGEGTALRELARVPAVPVTGPGSQTMHQLSTSQPVEIGGQSWLLVLERRPTSAGWVSLSSALILPLGGLLITGCLEGFLLLTSGHERQQQRDLQRKLRMSLTAAAKAHEIKQPLARLLLQARTIRNQGNPREPMDPRGVTLQALSEGIARDAREVSEAIDGIRNLLGSQDQPMCPVNLSDVVDSALLILRNDFNEHRIQLMPLGLEQGHWIQGDPSQLQVMVINLLRNAIRACGIGGRVALALRESPLGVVLEISDDGPGFPEGVETIDALFLRSTQPEGTGLGLFLVSCAVENHQGRIRIGRSSLGGALVRVDLPPLLPMQRLWQRRAQARSTRDGRFRASGR